METKYYIRYVFISLLAILIGCKENIKPNAVKNFRFNVSYIDSIDMKRISPEENPFFVTPRRYDNIEFKLIPDYDLKDTVIMELGDTVLYKDIPESAKVERFSAPKRLLTNFLTIKFKDQSLKIQIPKGYLDVNLVITSEEFLIIFCTMECMTQE